MYRQVLKGDVMEVSSPKVAEIEKILENTFRDVDIALANEMAVLCKRMGIGIWEVIDEAIKKREEIAKLYIGRLSNCE